MLIYRNGWLVEAGAREIGDMQAAWAWGIGEHPKTAFERAAARRITDRLEALRRTGQRIKGPERSR